MDISFDRYSMLIDGRREFICSGAMHYFRLPSQELWRDRLFKLKAAGYNAVDLYFCWGYHSPEQGVYDFEGIRDVRKLLEITQEMGFYVIARPGPYINAEYSGGGFPGWLLAKRDLPLRNRREGAFEWSDEYMGYVREWWEQIIPIINEFPNILMLQIENEYATLEVEPDYMKALYEMAREMGVKVPLFHNDLYIAGLYEDIVDIYAFDNYSVTQFETNWREMPEIFQVLDNVENNLRPFCQNRPLMAAELQAGWYGTWKGYPYEQITEGLGREHIGISTKSLVGQGLTVFNHYKAIGGTNWNFIGSIETYTSYDFGAPISEAGVNTERLFEAKALNYFLKSFDIVATDRVIEPPFTVSDPAALYAVRSPVGKPDSYWIFLRNLTWEPKRLTLNESVPLEIRPFEVQILPFNLTLECGYVLHYSSVEALYQNESVLVLKGNRPVQVRIAANEGLQFEQLDAVADIEVRVENGGTVLTCDELPPDGYRFMRLGKLNILILGQALVDTFWVDESGQMVIGAHERLPNNQYGLAHDHYRLFFVPRDGRDIHEEHIREGVVVDTPPLVHWQVYDEATELRGDGNFRKVSSEGADFDTNRLYEGSAWYSLTLNGDKPSEVEIDARHIWAVFLNGQLLGHDHQLLLIHGLEPPPPAKLPVPDKLWKTDGTNQLTVFVDGLGHPKGFHDDAQTPEGLLMLKVGGRDCTSELSISADFKGGNAGDFKLAKVSDPSSRQSPDVKASPVVRLATEFTLNMDRDADIPWSLQLRDMDYERVNIYLNRILIGRYWRDCQRQTSYYLPQGILKTEPGAVNKLELIVMNFSPFVSLKDAAPNADQVALAPVEVFTKVSVPAKLEI